MATATYREYADRAGAILWDAVTVAWTGGTTGYYSRQPFRQYEPRLITVGSYPRSIQEIGAQVPLVEVELILADTDKVIARRLEGAYDCRRSVVTVQSVSPELGTSDWFTRFTGVVDSWSYSTGQVALKIRTDDTALRNSFVPRAPILQSEWASIPVPDAKGYLPLVYGVHSSAGLTGKGFLPGVRVYNSGTTSKFVLGHGRLKTISATYLDSGTTVTPTTTYPVVAGKLVTLVQVTDGTITATTGLNADVEGIESTGDGTGAYITNPVSQLWHFADNFVWGDYRSGNWVTPGSVAPIDTVSWGVARDWADMMKLEGSWRIADQVRAQDVVNGWLSTWGSLFKVYWLPSGKLAMRVLSLAWPGYPTASSRRASAFAQDIGRSVSITQDTSRLTRQVSMKHLYAAASGTSYGSLDVQDLSQPERVTETLNMEFSVARAV